jgi:hypothetical protein
MPEDRHPQASTLPGPQVAPQPRSSSLMVVLLSVVLLGGGTGCGLLRTTAELPGRAVNTVTPGKPDSKAVDPLEVQQNLLRFADSFSTRMFLAIDRVAQDSDAMDPAEALRWKLAVTTETCGIASAPNPVANLLDMTVFVTVMRVTLEEHWQPDVFGPSAQIMLDSCRNAETEIWGQVGQVLKPAQQEELRTAIAKWHQENPRPEDMLAARAFGLAAMVGKATGTDTTQAGSVFGILMIDPLAGMDPAVREIAKTRMFAERALFVSQMMPTLFRWQTELFSLNAAAQPAVHQLVTNSTQITASIERFAAVAEKLPDLVSTEREEIVKALEAQEQEVTGLLTNTTRASDSLNATLKTLDALMQRFGVGETNKDTATPATNAEPFRIQDYTATAAQLEATARQLTELITTLDRTMSSTNLEALASKVTPAAEKVEASGRAVVDYAFWKGVLLVLTVLLAALAYRFITGRLHRSAKN